MGSGNCWGLARCGTTVPSQMSQVSGCCCEAQSEPALPLFPCQTLPELLTLLVGIFVTFKSLILNLSPGNTNMCSNWGHNMAALIEEEGLDEDGRPVTIKCHTYFPPEVKTKTKTMQVYRHSWWRSGWWKLLSFRFWRLTRFFVRVGEWFRCSDGLKWWSMYLSSISTFVQCWFIYSFSSLLICSLQKLLCA